MLVHVSCDACSTAVQVMFFTLEAGIGKKTINQTVNAIVQINPARYMPDTILGNLDDNGHKSSSKGCNLGQRKDSAEQSLFHKNIYIFERVLFLILKKNCGVQVTEEARQRSH